MTDIALDEIRRRVRNIWGAISSNQVIDKDVEGQAKQLLEYIDDLRRASPSQVAPQPQAGEPVQDTWFTAPQPANPAQVTDAMVEAVLSWVCDDVLPAYDIPSEAPRSDPELPDSCRAALTAAIGAGGQAVAEDEPTVEMSAAGMRIIKNTQVDHFHKYAGGIANSVYDAMRKAAPLSQPHPADERVVEARVHVPEGQTPLDDKLGHRLLDVIREGEKARNSGTGSPYHGHSLEHCLHAVGWVQRDLRLALDAAEAENARLRALPLKDEVGQVLEEVRDNGLIYWEPNTARGQDRKTAVVDRLDALLSRLRAGEQEGWKLVPVKPTQEMIAAGANVRVFVTADENTISTWEAMLVAASSELGGDRG